ncbi:Autophagy protein 7 [Perkinsus chesapeaki]|uniref:Autophagy protein 7 n=1 Tax=Perkinsus chesapeaki TaxID=330153 RepID=A0A7J6MZF5_PERCH|nr:Autophagy protein 7 [Perkinsus chesapeaki]
MEEALLAAINKLRVDPKGVLGSLLPSETTDPTDHAVVESDASETADEGHIDGVLEGRIPVRPLEASPSLSAIAQQHLHITDKTEATRLIRDGCMRAGYTGCVPFMLDTVTEEHQAEHSIVERLMDASIVECGIAVQGPSAVIILSDGSVVQQHQQQPTFDTQPDEVSIPDTREPMDWADVVELAKPASLRVPKEVEESVARLSRPKDKTVSMRPSKESDMRATADLETGMYPALIPQGYILNRVVRAFVSQCDTDYDCRVTAEDIISMARANGSHRAKSLKLVVENIKDMIADIAARRPNHPVRAMAEGEPSYEASVTWFEIATTMRERKRWVSLDEESRSSRIDNLNKHWVYQRDKFASLWVLALSVCGFKAFVPIEAKDGQRQGRQGGRIRREGILKEEEEAAPRCPSFRPEHSYPNGGIFELVKCPPKSKGEVPRWEQERSFYEDMVNVDRAVPGSPDASNTFTKVRAFDAHCRMIQSRSDKARDSITPPKGEPSKPPIGGSTQETYLSHFHNSCSVPPRRFSEPDPCGRLYCGIPSQQNDPGPYEDKGWDSVYTIKPDYRLSQMDSSEREGVWDTVSLPRRARQQYKDRCKDKLEGRAELVGRYNDRASSASWFREDNPARHGTHGRRVYDTQVRCEPLAPAISEIDRLLEEAARREREKEYEEALRDNGVGPGFKAYMPKADAPYSKYHNIVHRDLGLGTIIHDKPPPEVRGPFTKKMLDSIKAKSFKTFTRPLDACDMDRRLPVGPPPCCKTLTRRELADHKLNVQRLSTTAVDTTGEIPPQDASRILIVFCYADLKNFKFTYNCAVPRIGFNRPLIASEVTKEEPLDSATLARLTTALVLLAHQEDGRLTSIDEESSSGVAEVLVLVSSQPGDDSSITLPWYMSTILASIISRGSSAAGIRLRLVDNRGTSLRLLLKPANADLDTSLFDPVPGWVAFPSPKGKPSATTTLDLRRVLDPASLVASATDLNVRLMQWRVLPSLDPDRIMSLRCLLIGAGTLGCAVSRTLVGWGVKHITFVDSGHVSFSNPARQNLFTYEDAVARRPKAEAAASRLAEIVPNLQVRGVQLEVPMPGKSSTGGDVSAAVEELDGLVGSHDVVFLLTDSRESRWLPTVMVAAKAKGGCEGCPPLGVSVALGFDSYLVKVQSYGDRSSACYFCNDVSAPSDSTSFRTLDQMCTVTRPGLAIAVELVATFTQSGGFGQKRATDDDGSNTLGATPDQIRGFLGNWQQIPAVTQAFDRCVACSDAITAEYVTKGADFVIQATKDASVLEEKSGLASMLAAAERAHDDLLAFSIDDEDF